MQDNCAPSFQGGFMTGILIAVEGIDGSGKSSLVTFLETEVRRRGLPVTRVMTRESDREEAFLGVMKAYGFDAQSPEYMFFFQMLHADKVTRAMRALAEGHVVIADRWDFSFFIYHDHFGFFEGEDQRLRDDVSRLAFRGLQPTLGIYLDVDVDAAFDRRVYGRGESIDDVEKERIFYKKIVDAYRGLVRQHAWQTIDANRSFEEVKTRALELLGGII